MKKRSLWRLSVQTSAESEDALTEWFARKFGQAASSYHDAETGATTVSVFVEKQPAPPVSIRAMVREKLAELRVWGLATAPSRVTWARVRREDWSESWKRHFPPLEVGSSLLVKPSWSQRRPRRGQQVIVLDPGLSFGTGQHPTTAFCLEQVARWRSRVGGPSFLDVGTGSGILAIAAAKLGYRPVDAFDLDPEAVRVARGNARQNGVGALVSIRQADIDDGSAPGAEKYSVICANLVSTLLLKNRDALLDWLQPGGVLVIAGILKTEFPAVRKRYEATGLKLVASRAGGEWRSGAFARGRAS